MRDGMTADEFARRVAQEVLNKKPNLGQGEYVWQGTNAFLVWLLNAVGWRKIFDSTMEGGVGLSKEFKISIHDKAQNSPKESSTG